MIRWIYDNWASKQIALIINVLVFGVALFLPNGPLLYLLWIWGFGCLGVYWYGVQKGWHLDSGDNE